LPQLNERLKKPENFSPAFSLEKIYATRHYFFIRWLIYLER